MLTGRLAFSFAFAAAAALVCILIGVALARRRPVQGDAQRAATAFAVWWIALGVDALINVATFLLGALGLAPAWLIAALTYLAVAAISVMLWGLVTYLAYLYTGRHGVFRAVTLFYVASCVLMLAVIARLGPNGVTLTEWSAAVAYAREPPAFAGPLVAVFFLLPPIVGALAYLALGLRVKDRYRRFRAVLVGTSLFVWFGVSIALSATPDSLGAQIVGRVVGASAIAGLALAYFTPAGLRRRMGAGDDALHPVPGGRPDAHLGPTPAERERQRGALQDRARELI